MNMITRFLLLTLILLPASLTASPVSTRLNKVYKELLIQGERPEISSCMALAFRTARDGGPYEQIYYSTDAQDAALVQEGMVNGELTKIVIMSAKGQPRQQGFYVRNSLEKMEIVCTQIDEGVPTVKFRRSENP